jgi:hypothetical protein
MDAEIIEHCFGRVDDVRVDLIDDEERGRSSPSRYRPWRRRQCHFSSINRTGKVGWTGPLGW